MAKAPYKAGYTGGRMRPYRNLLAAVDAVHRLWIDGRQQEVYRLNDDGVTYRRVQVFTSRPKSAQEWADSPAGSGW